MRGPDAQMAATFRQLAAWLSPNDADVVWADAVQPATDWTKLLALAERHRVTPALADAVARRRIVVPYQHQTALDAALRSATFDELALAASVRAISGTFAQAKLPLGILKGVPLSLQLHGRVGLRVSRDIDLLVRAQDLAPALDMLAGLGFLPLDASLISRAGGPARLIRQRKDIELAHRERRQIIELHWRLFDNPHLLPLADPLPLEMVRLPLDLTCHVLPAALNLRYLATHGCQHGWSRLKWLVDFAALLARVDPDERAALFDQTSISDGRRALGQSMLLCEDLFGMVLPSGLRDRLLSDRRIGRLAKIARHCLIDSGARELEMLRFGSTAKNLSHYLLSTSPAYLAAEARFDLGDLSAMPAGSPWRRLGPAGRLGAWLTRHWSLQARP